MDIARESPNATIPEKEVSMHQSMSSDDATKTEDQVWNFLSLYTVHTLCNVAK